MTGAPRDSAARDTGRTGGWNDPETAAHYEAFCRRHSRYRGANRELVSKAALEPGMRIVDLGAGTGRTAWAALPHLGVQGQVVCVEPSPAMRAAGMARARDSRVQWRATLPRAGGSFDRVLCGAAIWQITPVARTFRRLADLLRPGGALVFTIPALYLQESDLPGGGSDPLLLSLPAQLAAPAPAEPQPPVRRPLRTVPLTRALVTAWLEQAGYRTASWTFRLRLTQDAYAEWLKIPVVSEGMLGAVPPRARARRIDRALRRVDRSSWKWERWRGWTAWRL